MEAQLDIVILLTSLVGQHVSQNDATRLTRVVEANQDVFSAVRDELWQAGERQAATKVDRLLSAFHPACKPEVDLVNKGRP